MSSTHKG
jgi:hypothetical protein